MPLPAKTPEFSLLLPDIRSGFNVGSFFRTADGIGLDHIFLSGRSAYPPHKEIAKTALGAEQTVSWSYHLDPTEILAALRREGVSIAALEVLPEAEEISRCSFRFPLCLVVGNEVSGIPENLCDLSDRKIFLPMRGKKESFNVAVAGAIALWEIAKKRYTV